jgi:protein-S-isoprenylcysteine O-methyltransferase Ste14
MKHETPSPRTRQVAAGILLVLLGWFAITYSRRYGLVLPRSAVLDMLSASLLLVGVAVRVMAFKEIRCTYRIKNLVISGIYSRTRNPVYLAFMLIIAGIALLSRGLLALAWALVSVAVLYYLAKKEEKDLEKAFGHEYMKYKKRVPMFLPRFRE